jgi:hypothetical protein
MKFSSWERPHTARYGYAEPSAPTIRFYPRTWGPAKCRCGATFERRAPNAKRCERCQKGGAK